MEIFPGVAHNNERHVFESKGRNEETKKKISDDWAARWEERPSTWHQFSQSTKAVDVLPGAYFPSVENVAAALLFSPSSWNVSRTSDEPLNIGRHHLSLASNAALRQVTRAWSVPFSFKP
ncbi:hypothetical protein TRVL_07613 [Trypanosoma vivax]|nr:hypothetical protein TRVL_07613 [Trypanosoma vivax]